MKFSPRMAKTSFADCSTKKAAIPSKREAASLFGLDLNQIDLGFPAY